MTALCNHLCWLVGSSRSLWVFTWRAAWEICFDCSMVWTWVRLGGLWFKRGGGWLDCISAVRMSGGSGSEVEEWFQECIWMELRLPYDWNNEGGCARIGTIQTSIAFRNGYAIWPSSRNSTVRINLPFGLVRTCARKELPKERLCHLDLRLTEAEMRWQGLSQPGKCGLR